MSKTHEEFIQQVYKHHPIGSYTTEKEAIIARLNAEIEKYGYDIAPQKHLFSVYDITLEEQDRYIK